MARSSVVLGTAPPLSALRRFDVTGGAPPTETPDTTLEIYDGAETSLPQSDAIVEWIGIHCSLKQPVISAYQLNKDVSKATALSQQELGRKDRASVCARRTFGRIERWIKGGNFANAQVARTVSTQPNSVNVCHTKNSSLQTDLTPTEAVD